MPAPARPRIYHIVHVDRLASITSDGYLWCDAVMVGRAADGTTIGMNQIKQRRLELPLGCHPTLRVGGCVPFYFCPRSVMLYLIWRANHPNLAYKGGQDPIMHLEVDLHRTVAWAEENGLRWAFTLSNAGSYYFEDRCHLDELDQINWTAVAATMWRGELEDGKQAEFLIENRFPWHLVDRIGVSSQRYAQEVSDTLRNMQHRPSIEIRRDWYY